MATYDTDIVAWANEQARRLRAGRFDALDAEHLADEIEDAGKSEQREPAGRMAVRVAHSLKWRYPGRRMRRGTKRIVRDRCASFVSASTS